MTKLLGTLLCSYVAVAAPEDVTGEPELCHGVPLAHWTTGASSAAGAAARPFSGYHVLCFSRAPASGVCPSGEEGACEPEEGPLTGTICRNGLRGACEALDLGEPLDLVDVEEKLIELGSLANPSRHRTIRRARMKKSSSWSGMFQFFSVTDADSGTPERIKSTEGLAGMVLVFEGGAFIWPGIAVGFQRNVTVSTPGADPVALQLVTRSLQPLIIEVSSFLSPLECKHIIKRATPHVAKSSVSHMDKDVGKPDTNWRSSSTYFMPPDDQILRRLDRRVSALTVTKVEQQEYTQVLRYEKGERYAAHHDYFDPKMYQSSKEVMDLTKKGLFNRLATVFFYLTTVEEGGQTNFPRAGGKGQPANFEDCDAGVSVSPLEGRIIIFYSLDPAGHLDEYSLHGGCSVGKGTKWSANKWIWNKGMHFIKG